MLFLCVSESALSYTPLSFVELNWLLSGGRDLGPLEYPTDAVPADDTFASDMKLCVFTPGFRRGLYALVVFG